jgi:MoaA/NifB/PqqE/SkfB family radical SAM enzyme
VPAFLIASISDLCNLRCAGCYSRANHACSDGSCLSGLSSAEWGRIFTEAAQLGVSFVLLAGGEPLLRRDVIVEAAAHRSLIFPVFTNGTVLDAAYLALFDENRNLIPILSLEGGREATDARRGEGVYEKLLSAMDALHRRDILFGVSVTVTVQNLSEVTSEPFLSVLRTSGCAVVLYVEYVPADGTSQSLAPAQEDRELLEERLSALRAGGDRMLYISFPGDEKASGGCLAAGRGFFHINASGGAEPCPFSPFSDTSLRDKSLREALRSPLFTALSGGGLLTKDHTGGCVLFEQEEEVRRLCGML